MNKELNPKGFGLNSRVVLQQINADTIAIVKKRKSRIIMKDGKQILEQATEILKNNPKFKIALLVSGPVCSKTTKFLAENGIAIIKEDTSKE